ncbi:MAG TPA: hypothetical protein VGL23_00920 [Chloroflexota bacterium]
MSAPLIWDDLHLIRAYSADELAATWHGSWDPDGEETPGLRPLTTAFNHLRFALFGESVAGQRVLLIAMLALDLTLLYLLARELFGAPPALGLAAGLLALSHTSTVGTYLWIADGVHPWELLWLIAALLLLARYLSAAGRPRRLAAASLLCAAVALLIRPEASLLLPLATLIAGLVLEPEISADGGVRTLERPAAPRLEASPLPTVILSGPRRGQDPRPSAADEHGLALLPQPQQRVSALGPPEPTGPGQHRRALALPATRRRGAGYLAALSLLLVGFWAWQLATVRLEPAWVFAGELAWALREVVIGPGAPLPPPLTPVSAAVLVRAVCGSAGLAALAIAASRTGRRRALFWAAAGAVGALHTLVGARSNLLLLPVAFWAVAVATLAADAIRTPLGRAVALVVFAPLVASQVLLGAVLQAEHRWNNLEWACTHALALYGDPPLRGIPPDRRESLAGALAALGIRSERDVRAGLPTMVAEALRDGRLGPGPDDRLFVPRLSLLVGPGRWITPCGEQIARLAQPHPGRGDADPPRSSPPDAGTRRRGDGSTGARRPVRVPSPSGRGTG